MFKNYLKTAWRNSIRNKAYTALNIVGLGTGMAVALIIGLWVYNEYSYDEFLPDTGEVYRVRRNYFDNGDTLTFTGTSLKLANVLRDQVPEIEFVAESDWMGSHGLVAGEKKMNVSGGEVGTDFLKIFQFPLLAGNTATIFKDAYSIVITESLAKALFGNENPINKLIRYDNKDNLKVTGILKDVPYASSFKFSFLVPFSYADQTNDRVKAHRNGSFGSNAYQLFLKLKKGVSSGRVMKKIRDIEHSETDSRNAMNSYVILQPLANWHLYSKYVNGKETGGFLEYVRIFSVTGALILLIACINFINLTTARSEKRAREVGVRKAIGSERKHLIFQFLVESLLLTTIAMVLAIVLAQVTLPFFNALTGGNVTIPFNNFIFWTVMLLYVICIALISGSRPAFYFSSFKPVKVLKGTLHVGTAAALPRKILVTLQFSCSVALIISSIIIYQQIKFAKNRPLGYDTGNLMITGVNNDLSKNFTALKNELLEQSTVENLTVASSPATEIYSYSDVDEWPGKKPGETVEMGTIVAGDDYFKTLGMTMEQGRDFTNLADTASAIFNEAAIKRLRLTQPLDQQVTFGGVRYKIVGVVKDALAVSPFSGADPTLFLYSRKPNGFIMYRLKPGSKISDAVDQLTAVFNKYSPAYPYAYQFADANYEAKFNLELLTGKLAGILAALAILISCLGLFGLAAYVAEKRTKEIGIRKVLGASVSQVWLLLSKDFIGLVLISCMIATPVAYYFLHGWLQKYDYRISISPVVFILATVVAVIITITTISFQAIRAAIANPVKSLRTE